MGEEPTTVHKPCLISTSSFHNRAKFWFQWGQSPIVYHHSVTFYCWCFSSCSYHYNITIYRLYKEWKTGFSLFKFEVVVFFFLSNLVAMEMLPLKCRWTSEKDATFYFWRLAIEKTTAIFLTWLFRSWRNYGKRYKKKWIDKRKVVDWPSRLIPTAMHFLSRQYWHRLRLMRRMEHCWFLVHGRYWIFCWMLRRKKPCNHRHHHKKEREKEKKKIWMMSCYAIVWKMFMEVERTRPEAGLPSLRLTHTSM